MSVCDFDQILARIGLSAEDAAEFLELAPSVIAQYLAGKVVPQSRDLRALDGLAFALAVGKERDLPLISRTVAPERMRSRSDAYKGKALGSSSNHSDTQMSKMLKRRGSQRLTSLELCAGGGGAALGMELAGFEPRVLLEIDPHACATLRHNRPYWNVVQADMRSFDAGYWGGVDLVSGGLPCPPFSIAGKQLGEDDERNLFPAMIEVVRKARPRAVLIENVRGILSERFSSFRARVDRALDVEGFDTHWMGLNAVNFGVPQTRFRAFLVALRRGETKPLKWPIEMRSRPVTVGETIGVLMAERGWRGAENWAVAAAAPAPTIVGGSHKHGGPDLGPTRARREWAELGVDGLGLADSAPDSDFQGMPRLTVPMVARLQTFPDDWTFLGSKTHAYRQVGNALPVQLAFHIGSAVRDALG